MCGRDSPVTANTQTKADRDTRFLDRRDAGRQLAFALREYTHRSDVLVLGLPRGGVPVAAEVAAALDAPLDVLIVRKLGVPGHEELAMGAVASGGVTVFNHDIIGRMGIPQAAINRVTSIELAELARRDRAFRGDAAPADASGRIVILVDDGLATGASMAAAVEAVRFRQPSKVVVAVPVASVDAARALRLGADDVVTVMEPEPFYGVGMWYQDFTQTSDEEVRRLLADGRDRALARTGVA